MCKMPFQFARRVRMAEHLRSGIKGLRVLESAREDRFEPASRTRRATISTAVGSAPASGSRCAAAPVRLVSSTFIGTELNARTHPRPRKLRRPSRRPFLARLRSPRRPPVRHASRTVVRVDPILPRQRCPALEASSGTAPSGSRGRRCQRSRSLRRPCHRTPASGCWARSRACSGGLRATSPRAGLVPERSRPCRPSCPYQ